jgi:hypothetical protein
MQLFGRFSAALALCCAMLGACGDSTAPKDPDVTLDMLLTDIGDAGALGENLTGGMPRWATVTGAMPSGDACPYQAFTQQFVCHRSTSNGLTTSRYFQLLDALGAAQSAFSATTTAAIRTQHHAGIHDGYRRGPGDELAYSGGDDDQSRPAETRKRQSVSAVGHDRDGSARSKRGHHVRHDHLQSHIDRHGGSHDER